MNASADGGKTWTIATALVRCSAVAAVACIAAGCSGGTSSDATTPVSDVPVTAVKVVETSASPTAAPPSGPQPSGPTVVFESVEFEDGLVADIPVGWVEHEFLEGNYSAPDDGRFDIYPPSYWVSQQCAGECVIRSSAEWAATVDAVFFEVMRAAEETVVVRETHDETTALLETLRFGWIDLQISRWVDGQDHLVTCQLSLHEEHSELLAQFEQACMAASAPALDAPST